MNLPRPARAVLLPALVALAACSGGGGPSVTGAAGESARSESGLSSLWEKARGLSVEQAKTVEMPAFALIADALASNAHEQGAVEAFALGKRGRVVALMANHRENLPPLGMYEKTAAILSGGDKLLDPAFKLGDPKQAAELDRVRHALLAVPVLFTLAPFSGWDANPMREDRNDVQNYTELVAASAIYTNALFAEIARRLDGTVLADPESSKAAIWKAYLSIPWQDLRAMLADASKAADGQAYTLDLAGGRDVHFSGGPGDFVGDARGVVWTNNGMTWFGDGRINGQTVNFRLASTASLSQRQAQSGSSGTTSGADVSGGGSIGAGR